MKVDGRRYFQVNGGPLVVEYAFGYNAVTIIAEDA